MSKHHVQPALLAIRIKELEAEMRLGFKPKNWEHVFIETNIARMPPSDWRIKLHDIAVDRVWVAHWEYRHPDDWNQSSDPRTRCKISLAVRPHRDHVESNAVFCQDCILLFVERELALEEQGVS